MMPDRFALTELPIDPAAERLHLSDPRAGGFASFEGWVRDHDGGLAVGEDQPAPLQRRC